MKCIEDEIPFELPDGWAWCRLGTISFAIQYGLSNSAEQTGTHRLLRITDIQNGNVNWNEVPFTTIKNADDYLLHKGDIVFARTGATVSKSYLIKSTPFPAVYASYLIRISLLSNIIPEYIYHFFNSQCYWEQITDKSVGVGQPNCNETSLKELFYTLTMQLSRDSFANLIEGKNIVNEVSKGYFSIDNPVFNISENLASKISSSGIAQTEFGEVLGLENITGKEVIGGAVTVAIVFGPDIARVLVGRISPKQLAKNASVGLAGMIGGIIGQSLIPIPIVGAMVGSITTSFVVKKTLDVFIEDDAKEMFRILKEEFLDTTMLAGLNPKEFEEVVSLTVGYKKLPKQLQKMYQSQEFRRYAREAIMLPAINTVLSKRQMVTNEVYVQELKLLAAVN